MMRRLLLDRSAASAAEFALVLPLLLLLLFGIIDGGRWMWAYNQAEKATQMGARFAVVAYPVTDGINASYIGVNGLTQGDLIPASAFGKITCDNTGCTCATTPCPSLGTYSQANFQHIVDRMKLFAPGIGYSNVKVEYSSSGLGYAGNPNGADLSPLVTIELSGLQFTPITTLMLATLDMPSFTTTLSAEDLTGNQSN
jgi:Flp pilus assembly protein TadG